MKRGTPDHPKTHALAAALGLDRWGAVGVLECLFHFAATYARRGDIGRHPDVAIARGIGWSGDPDTLIRGLVTAGWLDCCRCHRLRVHDWHEHADQTARRSEDVQKHGFITCYADASSLLAADEQNASQPLPLPLPLPLPTPEPEPTPLPVRSRAASVENPPLNGNGAGRGIKPEDRPSYADACWEEFRQRFSIQRLTCSSVEGVLVQRWMEQGIPLAVVLRGIGETGGAPRNLTACERPVQRCIEDWYSKAGLIAGGAA